jgi:hypothetical protein
MHRIKTSDTHISVLARPWTARTIRDACLLSFGSTDPEQSSNKKLRTTDEWLRFNIMRFLMERAWGRAPMEIKFETAHNVNVKYTEDSLLDLLWSKYRLSGESRLQHQQVLLDNPNLQAVELDFDGYPGPSCSMRADLGGLIVRSSATFRYWLKV